MVVTCHRAHSPADAGAAVTAMVEVSTQRELQVVDTALEVPGCRECLRLGEVVFFPGVLLLQSCATKRRSYGKESAPETMREVDRIFSETLWLQEPQTPTAGETQVESVPSRTVSANSEVGEG